MLTDVIPRSALALLLSIVTNAVATVGVPMPTHTVAAPISCAEGRYAAEIDGGWVCVLVAEGSVDAPAQVVEVTGERAYRRWCPNPSGLGPPGYGGSPEPHVPAQGATVPCHLKEFGWWDGTGCYYHYERKALPTDEGWEDHPDGLLYRVRCFLEHMDAGGLWEDDEYVVLPEPPPFEGGEPPSLLSLWMEAVNSLVMVGPQIGTAPPTGQGSGLVWVPVWMWDEGAAVSGPVTAGPVLGQSVQAQARVAEVAWDPGDGSPPVVCGQGVAWEPGMEVLDPPCGHAYPRASRDEPGGMFEVIATTSWHLEWWVNGVWDGELFLPASSTVDIQVDEIQVLTG